MYFGGETMWGVVTKHSIDHYFLSNELQNTSNKTSTDVFLHAWFRYGIKNSKFFFALDGVAGC